MKTLCGLLLMLVVHACTQAAELFGSVDALSGTAFIADQAGVTQSVQPGQPIYQGQTISSGPDGEVHIVTVDGGIVALRPDTVFRVDQYRPRATRPNGSAKMSVPVNASHTGARNSRRDNHTSTSWNPHAPI